jgi:hypothetical protein
MRGQTIRKAALTVTMLLAFVATASAQEGRGRYLGSMPGADPATIKTGAAGSQMDNKPYSASYLPRTDGPLSRQNDAEIKDMIEHGFGDCDLVHQIVKDNAKKTTTEKFDAAVKNAEGRDPKMTDDYNKNGYNPNAEGWEGFCHLWSPSGLDPASAFIVSMDKIYANVPFGIGDLKELATWTYPSPGALFIGTRNYGTKPDSEELTPADMLTALQNYIGPGKAGVVMDIDPGVQVWNQPFYSYKTDSTELTGADAVGAPAGGHVYKVKINTQYGKEGSYAYRGDTYLYDLNWTAKVTVDKNGKVVDSSWIKDESDRIPDFIWVPNDKRSSPNYDRLQKIAKDGVAVSDIESFCKTMQSMTADSFKNGDGKKAADLLNKICPVLDQNKLNAYIKDTAKRTGIDYSVLDSALSGNDGGNG